MADNSVNIPVTLDLSGVKTGVQQIDKLFDETAASAKQAANSMGKGMAAFNTEAKRTKGLIEDIEDSIKDFETAKRKAMSPEDVQKWNKKIEEANRDLKKINGTLKENKAQVKSFADSANEQFSRIGTAIVAAFAFSAVKQFIASSIESFKQAEEASIKLSLAYGENQKGYRDMVRASAEFQSKLNIPDEVFQNQAAFLKEQGRTDEEIKKIIKTAQGLKVQLGTDLQGAVIALNETFDGGAGKLEKYRSGTEKLTESQLQNGAMVDELFDKYGNLAEEIAGTTLGQTEKAALNFDNLKESIGGAIVELLAVTGVLPKVNEELEKMSENLSDDRLGNWERFATGAADKLQKVAAQNEIYIKRLIIDYEAAKKAGDEEAKDFYAQQLAKIKASEDFGNVYKHVINDLKDARAKSDKEEKDRLEEKKKLTDAEIEAQKKANEEWLKAQEALQAKLRALEIENTEDKQLQIRMRLEDEIKAVEKSKGNEETKQKIIKALIEKAHREIEELEKGHMGRMQTIAERGNAEAIQAREDGLKEFQLRSEEIKKKEFSQEDQDKIDLAGFLGIELKEGDELDKLKESLDNTLGIIEDFVSQALDNYVKLKEGRVSLLNEQLDENQRSLDQEYKNRERGFASDVDLYKKRDAELKKQRDKAQADLEKAQKKQMQMNLLMQTSELITAVAKIWSAESSKGTVGVALAIIETAAIFSSFAAAVDSANAATKYEKGGTWVEGGKRHSQGGNNYGHIEVEQGERMAVFNRQATERNSGLASLVESINRGELVIDKDKMSNLVNGGSNIVVNVGGQKELQNIEKLLYEQNLKSTSARSYRYGNTLTLYRN